MVNGLDEMMDKLENGEADMIASGMTATVERKSAFNVPFIFENSSTVGL